MPQAQHLYITLTNPHLALSLAGKAGTGVDSIAFLLCFEV